MPSLLHSLASTSIALSFVSPILAFNSISIPETVQAGTNTDVTITNDLTSGPRSFDAQFTNYNLYLSVSAPNWGQNPVCLLFNGSDIHSTSLTVKIPASVGPDASNYSLVTVEYNTDVYSDNGLSGYEYSNDFALTGATGVWSAYETDPRGPQSLGDPDSIPCSAYDCARQCNQKYYPADFDQSNTAAYEAAYEASYKCVAACPGVTYPSWDSVVAPWTDDGDDDDGDDEEEDDDDDEDDDAYSAASSTIPGAAMSTSFNFISSSTSSPPSSAPATKATATSSPSTTTVSPTSSPTASISVTTQTASSAVSRVSLSTSMSISAVIFMAGWLAAGLM